MVDALAKETKESEDVLEFHVACLKIVGVLIKPATLQGALLFFSWDVYLADQLQKSTDSKLSFCAKVSTKRIDQSKDCFRKWIFKEQRCFCVVLKAWRWILPFLLLYWNRNRF